jgi:pSer/pThr/pTyr-binding forkhead associated (FHA) protein
MPKAPPDDSPLAAPLWQSGLAADPMLGVFRKHFAALRAAHSAQHHPGVLVAAIDRSGLFDAHVHLRLPQSGIAHLIIGRHERCDFVLSRDNDVSLRHVLVRATRGESGQTQLRAIDLRSRVGLLSEDGRRCEAIASRGPLFLHVASYVVFLLPTGPSVRPWTRDPDDTWRGFSPRSQEILPPPQPLKSRAAPAPDAVRLATITITSSSPQAGDLTSTHAVWSDQLERGILVGRDDRCSHGGLDEGNLSRVHLVLLSVDDEVWAIDTASTNGTRVHEGPQFRQLLLSGATELVLADALSLRWTPSVLSVRA